MLLLSKADIKKIYSLKECISAVKDAFRLFSAGKVDVPLRTQIIKHHPQGTFVCMPAFCESYDASCVKILNMFPGNIDKGLATINAENLNLDTKTGLISGILDGNYITQLRTGAASGVALKYLAKKYCKKGALIGTGSQAAAQLEAMLISRKLKEVQVTSLNFDYTKLFTQKMSQQLARYKTKIKAVKSTDEAVSDADVIIL